MQLNTKICVVSKRNSQYRGKLQITYIIERDDLSTHEVFVRTVKILKNTQCAGQQIHRE